ncbi:SpaH/EbpB family LPXTG-anchored major pilin [Corynebacterium tapiri]|uniref:Isopeptide-forming domain-containing fimbrial protein n=1 Tax=Corynebacterium tapiri TaxID=1448266 RepID=A0A5C4U3D5_9CORY|nr:SpaH/EbpB family LPXTG-anchored major pilin [Corynebacterium tapiri]TNL96640.1 isopeptide-forming domain-containing fimbrial protein [Corynebacterium tapiri]
MTNHLTTRIAAALFSGGLALTTLSGPAALAQDVNQPAVGAPAAPAASEKADQIDPNHTVELIIKKYLGDPVAAGTTPEAAGLKPLQGAQFKIQRVDGVDLTTAAGWDTVSAVAAGKQQPTVLEDFGTIETDAQGVATISTGTNQNFKVGLYRVTEQQFGGYSVAPPFYITLPGTTDNGQWNYSQTVFPKNQNLTASKQIDVTNATIGSNVGFVINAPVPANVAQLDAKDQPIAGASPRFNIEDKLIDGLSLVTDPAPVVKAVSADGKSGNDVALAAGADYNLTPDNNVLRVEFTPAGLKKLNDLRKNDASLTVTVDFDAKITKPLPNGQLTNTATIELPNGAKINTDAPDVDGDKIPDPTSATFAPLTVTKKTPNQDADRPELNGAEFEVYRCAPDEQNKNKYNLLGEKLTVATTENGDPKDKIITGGGDNTQSTARAYSLPRTSFAAATGTQTYDYCVLEIKAPEGYIRNPEPQPVNFAQAEGAAGQFTVEVQNQRNSLINQLPATGAFGILIVFLIGAALLARGIYTSYRDSRASA